MKHPLLWILAIIFVDNVSLGANSVEEAYKIYLQLKEIFRKSFMNLREEFLDSLQKNEVVKGDFVKVFDIYWNCVENYLQTNRIDFFNWKIPPISTRFLEQLRVFLTCWV